MTSAAAGDRRKVPTDAASEPRGLAGIRAAGTAIVLALVFRAASYAVMTAAAIWNERRPAPPLPDLVLSAVPYVESVARANYLVWLLAYLPLAAALLWDAPRRFVRYTVTGALVSLARGATIALTGLGAPPPLVGGEGIRGRPFGEVLLSLLSPWGIFAEGKMQAYLTQDLFFSGHAATTFLLVLYAWDRPRLRAAAIAAHLVVVATVFLAHLHYAIDVVGAWAITFAIFVLREGWPPGRARSRVSA
jgi:hypothetical protein